ncbi:MAG: dihydroneopterin aldolase [Planctomycetales bacterium]|nr:dihydroneopterin aldolase [Planctomycetales bacterium]
MPDRVLIHDLSVDCIVGDLPHEREREQRVFVDLALEADVREAARTDDLRLAVDYVRAAEIATRVAVEGRFRLVEALAEGVARALLAEFRAAGAVEVRVRKPAGVPAAGWAGVEIRRERGSR